MPPGIGYGPLGLPPTMTDPLGVQPFPPLPAPAPEEEFALQPFPAEEPGALPVPSGLRYEAAPLPVPEFLRGVQPPPASGQGTGQVEQPVSVAEQPARPPDQVAVGRAVLEGVDANDPAALALAGANLRVDVQRAALRQQELASQALRKAEEQTAAKLEERARREDEARRRVAEQNTAIQQRLREGPGTTWRDVTRAGFAAAGALIGAALDRSGTLQRSLPQTLDGILQQWQADTQGAFARELQALQVGREGAQDELDAAMDDERQIEQAGLAAQKAILDESRRQIDLAIQQGVVGQAELEAAGVPGYFAAKEAELAAAQAAAEEEAARKALEQQLKLEETAASIDYKREQTRSERAQRAQGWQRLANERERLAMDREKSVTERAKAAAELTKSQAQAAYEQGRLEQQQVERAVPVMTTQGEKSAILVANQPKQAEEFAKQYASAEQLSQVLDAMALKLEEGDASWWGTADGQRLAADYTQALLLMKDSKELGVLAGPDMDVIAGAIGKDPNEVNWQSLRSQASRLRQTRDLIEREVNSRARAISSDWAKRGGAIELPRYRAPEEAVPTAQEARGALLPILSAVTGKRPRVDAQEFAASLKTLRETTAKEQGKERALAVQANAIADQLEAARKERARLARERDQRTKVRSLLKTDSALQAEKEAQQELRTIEEYEKRLAEALKLERRMLRGRVEGVEPLTGKKLRRPNARDEDADALRRVERLLGAGKSR